MKSAQRNYREMNRFNAHASWRRPGVILLAMAAILFFPSQSVLAKTVTIGTGSGYLNYPNAQATLNLQPGDTLYIAAGTYSGLSISNLSGSAAAPIIIQCDPNAVFTNPGPVTNTFSNLAYLRFENFRYENYASRLMQISGVCHDLLFKDFRLTNIGDYGFRIYDAAQVFNGSKLSTYYNFRWENMVVNGANCPVITNADWASVSNLKSMLLDFEIVGCTFSNIRGGVLELNKCFNLKLYNCTFSDIISANSHSACLYLSGYASVHHNEFVRHWGNDVRAFPMKLNVLGYDGPDAVSRYYNNISGDKTKYAAYEHNGVPQADLNASGVFSRTSSEIYFNTYYRSRKLDYVAPLVDVYAPYVTIKHNLVIEPECDAPFNPAATMSYVYHLGAGSQPGVVVENNLVYGTFAASGLEDMQSFTPSLTSPALDAATGTVPYITDDIYGNDRYVGPAADVGAVERPLPPALTGDYNGDATVDLADYTVWADHFGQTGPDLPGDGNGDGTVDLADYTLWADHFGESLP